MALALRCPPAATSSRSPFLPSPSPAPPGRLPRRPPASWRCHGYYGDDGFRKSYDHIPKQFREENLKDGRECSLLPQHVLATAESARCRVCVFSISSMRVCL
jgi:hypothetical protein